MKTELHEAAKNDDLVKIEDLVNQGLDVNEQDDLGHPPLHVAAKLGKIELVRSLVLKFGASVDLADKHGHTALHIAAGSNQDATMRCLVKECRANVSLTAQRGQTALHFAAMMGQLKAVKFLVQECKASVMGVDELGNTASNWANKEGKIEVAQYLVQLEELLANSKSGNIQKVNTLIKQISVDINDVLDQDGNTPLHLACAKGHLELAKVLMYGDSVEDKNEDEEELIILVAQPHYTNNLKRNTLHIAAFNGRKHIVSYLLEELSDVVKVNDIDAEGNTPLMLASASGHRKTAELLIQKGSDLKLRNEKSHDALACATYSGHLDVAKFLIAKMKEQLPKPDYKQSINSALSVACSEGHKDLAELMLQEKADINFEYHEGRTGFLNAALNEDDSVLKALYDHAERKGRKNELLNQTDREGNTALLLAACDGKFKPVEWLVDQKETNLYHANKNGETALKLAFRNNHNDIFKLLTLKSSEVIWSINLDVVYGGKKPYKAVTVYADEIHYRLRTLERTESASRKEDKVNYVAANIGFIITDRPHVKYGSHGRRFVDIPVKCQKVDSRNTVSVQDIFNFDDEVENKSRSKELKELLIKYAPTKEDEGEIESSYNAWTFVLDYHHSERALHGQLEKQETIKNIVDNIEQKYMTYNDFGKVEGYKLYSVVLDMHSTRYLCENCKPASILFQSSYNTFLTLLAKEFQKRGHKLPKNGQLHMLTRVSAEYHANNQKPKREEDHKEKADIDIRAIKKQEKSVILQRDDRSVKALLSSSYSIYSSREDPPAIKDEYTTQRLETLSTKP